MEETKGGASPVVEFIDTTSGAGAAQLLSTASDAGLGEPAIVKTKAAKRKRSVPQPDPAIVDLDNLMSQFFTKAGVKVHVLKTFPKQGVD